MGVIENRIPEDNDDITKEVYLLETAKIKKMCENSGAKYFEIDNEYNQEIQNVYKWIDEQITSRNLYTFLG